MRVLLVEDHLDIRRLFEQVIGARGHDVTACEDGESAWEVCSQRAFELVLLDWELRGGGMDGLQLCRAIRSSPGGDRCVIVMITAHDSPDALRTALQGGVNDYLVKPVGVEFLKLRLTIAEQWVESVRRRFAAEDQAQALQSQLADQGKFHDLIGRSPSMVVLYEEIQKLAAVDATVLIEGETGTGKELVARAIHLASRRASQTFLAVNCAGFTDSLLGSQLFGHKKGAFTGAIDNQEGVFEAAQGGTLFLDEIGDISPAVQTSLLRVLQEREITRLGESKPRKVDVRLVVATHHNLAEDVEKGTFRRDLLYRIKVARLRLTPLRDRPTDIPLLVHAFLGQFRSVMEKSVLQISPDALQVLTAYSWPGNVRELKSAVESALIHCKGTVVQVEDLPPEIRHPEPTATYVPLQREDERTRMVGALQQAGGNRSEAARLLGMSRRTFYRRLTEYDVVASEDRPQDFRP
ncbi:MAG: sigma-54-dependent Fis family transcriptional regulator [Nitrospira sp.]|nr:sigma-54-dependent Fis family transcriptional regulator [Nitrospira sp.]